MHRLCRGRQAARAGRFGALFVAVVLDPARRGLPLFEEISGRLSERVELGDEPVELSDVSPVDDRYDADADRRHMVGHRAQNLAGVSDGDRVQHRFVRSPFA
jgi:hypothetical protein